VLAVGKKVRTQAGAIDDKFQEPGGMGGIRIQFSVKLFG
jgi:hypothetical protein